MVAIQGAEMKGWLYFLFFPSQGPRITVRVVRFPPDYNVDCRLLGPIPDLKFAELGRTVFLGPWFKKKMLIGLFAVGP